MQTLPRNDVLASLLLLQKHGFTAGTFIDAGAAEGNAFVLRRLLNLFPTAEHFFIDALAEYEDVYRRVQARFKGGYAIAAVGSFPGEANIAVLPTHAHRVAKVEARPDAQPQADAPEYRKLPLTTLDALCRDHALRPPYVLYMDLDGGECDACRGGLEMLEQTVIVVSELQIFAEKDNFADFMHLMYSRGFVLFDITNLGYMPSDQSIYQC
jgi:FkbM family methyltransferase